MKVSVTTAAVSHVPVTVAVALPHLPITPVTSEERGAGADVFCSKTFDCCYCGSCYSSGLTVWHTPEHRYHCPKCFQGVVSSSLPKSTAFPVPAIFCFKCGEDSNTKRERTCTENLRLVNQKLVKQKHA